MQDMCIFFDLKEFKWKLDPKSSIKNDYTILTIMVTQQYDTCRLL